jgi:hypothetical protein
MEIFKIIIDGLTLSLIASLFIFITLRLNPRIWLQDYPKDIQDRVPSKTEKEKRLSLSLGIPFLILLLLIPLLSALSYAKFYRVERSYFMLAAHAFGVLCVFNIIDWLVLDWLIFCWITPRFVVIPGSEGAEGYKDYGFHFRGFLIGTVFSAIAGLVIGAILYLGYAA